MKDLLELLGDSQFHSGEELGKTLGVTRAAIWKKLKKLESLGVTIHSVKGRGYRIPYKLELLNRGLLEQAGMPSDVVCSVLFETDSTNEEVKRSIQAGQPLPRLVTAERQTQGRGRRGRVWQGGVGKNLAFSLGWRFENGAGSIEGLSLAVGVSIARVLESFGVIGVGLKWPNDVQISGRKVCGVLLEMVADQDSCQVIIGVGLNLQFSDSEMAMVDQPWTDLKREMGSLPSRNELLARLVDELRGACIHFSLGNGLSGYREEWHQRDILLNQPVTVISGNREEQGTARGIDEKGALLLEQGEQPLRSLFGGEVSVRRKA